MTKRTKRTRRTRRVLPKNQIGLLLGWLVSVTGQTQYSLARAVGKHTGAFDRVFLLGARNLKMWELVRDVIEGYSKIRPTLDEMDMMARTDASAPPLDLVQKVKLAVRVELVRLEKLGQQTGEVSNGSRNEVAGSSAGTGAA